MNVLAIDCSGDILSVGVGRSMDAESTGIRPQKPKHPFREELGHKPAPGSGFVELSIDAGFRHAERVMGAVDHCLSEAGLDPGDLDLLACAGGPGSFTGLRIGLSTIKGLALGLGKPFVLVPTLDAIAAGWEGAAPIVVPVLDARRSRFYYAVYESGRLAAGPFDDGFESMVRLLHDRSGVIFVGQDADLLDGAICGHSGWSLPREHRKSSIRSMASLAIVHYTRSGAARSDAGLVYLRASDAEEALNGKENART